MSAISPPVPSPSATAWRRASCSTQPTIEFSYKNDELGDPLLNTYHALALKLATAEEIETIKNYAFAVNEVLKAFWAECGVTLVDFKLEFGKAGRRVPSCWLTRSAPTPAACGTPRPMKSWIRTVSAGIWAALRTPTPRS